MILWNPAEQTDEENVRWCWLRAVEWNAFPAFVTLPVVPVFLLLWPWWLVISGVVVANVLWALLVRYRLVILGLAQFGALFVQLKWLTVPLAVVLLVWRRQYYLAVVALLWPWLAGVVGLFPHSLTGKTQQAFMARFGYEKLEGPSEV